MTRSRSTDINVLHDLNEYLEVATHWSAREPFPVLAGPALERFKARLEALGVPHLLAPRRRLSSGIVLPVGGEAATAVATLLARATGRRLEPTVLPGDLLAALATAADRQAERGAGPQSVAVVGLAEDLAGVGDWPHAPGLRSGVVTARNVQALAALVHRTLCAPNLPLGDDASVSHPALPGAAEADAVDVGGLRDLARVPRRLLTMSSHGRECGVNLPDGVLCGGPAPAGSARGGPRTRAAACQVTGSCYRTDVGPGGQVPAAEIDAQVVFLSSCAAVAVGANRHSVDVGVALGLLEGSVTAVVGPVGMLVAHPSYPAVFRDAVLAGASMGEAYERLQGSVRTSADLARFGLLGDPELVLSLYAGDAATKPAPAGWAASSAKTTAGAASAPVPGLSDRRQAWARLWSLRWLGVPVPAAAAAEADAAIRQDHLELRRSGTSAPVHGSAAALEHFQRAVATELVGAVHGDWWDFLGGAGAAYAQSSSSPASCPVCSHKSATDLSLGSRDAEVDLPHLRSLQCRRCGELSWATGPSQVTAPASWYAEPGRFASTMPKWLWFNTSDEEVTAHLGCAVVAGRHLGLPAGAVRRVAMKPGTGTSIGWVGPQRLPEVVDESQVVTFALVDGVLTLSISTGFFGTLPRSLRS